MRWLSILLLCGSLAAQIRQDLKVLPTGSLVVECEWTAASDGSVAATPIAGLSPYQGYRIVNVETAPGSPAPTNGYAIQFADALGTDLMGGSMTGLSSTVAQMFAAPSSSPLIYGSFQLVVTGNSVSLAQGRVLIYISNPSIISLGSGVNSVTGLAPIASTGGVTPVISLNNTAVTPGSYQYTALTVDGTGRLTAASNGTDFVASGPSHARGTVPDPGASAGAARFLREDATFTSVDLSTTQATGILAAGRFPALTGDVTTPGGSLATTLATSGVTAGTYTKVTVDAKGRTTLGATANVNSDLTGYPLTVPNGGLGVATLTSNGVLYGNGTGVALVTAQGPANSVLAANAGAPAFSATPTVDGMVAGAATGGGQGTGTINIAGTYYVNGVRIPKGRAYYGCSGVPTSSSTLIFQITPTTSCTVTTENTNSFILVNSAGAIANLRVRLGANAVANTVITIRNNFGDTAATCTVTAGSNTCSWSGTPVPVLAGDVLSIKMVTGAAETFDSAQVAFEY